MTAARKEVAEISNRLRRATKEQESTRDAMDKEVKARDDQIHKLRQEVLVYTDENNRLKRTLQRIKQVLEEDLKRRNPNATNLRRVTPSC